MKDKLIEKIEQICEEHLDNTEIDSVDKCEDYHDHYLLAKVDMAKEILETITINKRKWGPMIILGKTKQEWQQLELQYRPEWIIFLVGFILGAIIF